MKIHITIITNKQAMSFRYIASTFLLLLLSYSGFAQVPTITSFAPASGVIGTTVIITGTNFNTTLANNIVFFGATRATVSSGSANSLTVVVPVGASYQPISVTNIINGLTAYSAQPFITTFPCGAITSSSFAAKVDFATALNPQSVSTGDLDGDGKLDLAVTNYGSATVSVFRNTGSNGTVSFATKVDFTTDLGPISVSIGDFDGDGKLDLAVLNIYSVSVLRNTGSSGTISFAAKVDFTTGANPKSVLTGDFDGNGKLDLAVANYGSNPVSVFRNTGSSGTISFASKVDFATGSNTNSVSAGDLDGDGKTDLAAVNGISNIVSVFRNISSGGIISFATIVAFTTGTNPSSVLTGDLDGDGKLDLAVSNIGSNSVSVLRNTGNSGTISFATKVDFTTGTNPIFISTGDLDGDGKLDLAIANYNSNSVSVFSNTGSSGTISFAAKVDFTTLIKPRSISIGDFDGDGKSDHAVISETSNSVSVFRNQIAACPPPIISSFMPSSGSIGTTVIITGTNFNTTPANNIVFFGATKATVSASSTTSLTVIVPVGASFQPISVTNLTTVLTAFSSKPFITTFACGGVIIPSSFAGKVDFTTGTQPNSVSTGDFDGDGKTDLAVANEASNTVSVFRNTGSSLTISFATKVDFTTGTNPWSVSTGDYNGDGKLDLAIANRNSGTVSVFRNISSSGTISFAAKVDFTTGTNPQSISTGDFDGDGKLDLAVANYNSTAVSVLRNTGSFGTISFAAKVDFTTGVGPSCITSSDFDGDGKQDLAVSNYSSATVSLFRNTGSSGTISFSSKLDFATGTNPQSVSIGDLDGDGKLDLAVTNYGSATVSVFRNTSSSGAISLASKVDFTTGANPYSVSISDLDGDGKIDIAIANRNSNSISVFRNTGSSGTISLASKLDFATGTNPQSVSIGDLDGNGTPELAVTNSSGTVSVIRNLKGICPPTITSFAPTSGLVGTTVIITGTKFNTTLANNIVFFGATRATVSSGNDTSLTVVVPAGASFQPISLTNITTGLIAYSAKPFINTFPCGGAINTNSFNAKVDFTTQTGPTSFSTGDFDGDGKPDLAVVYFNSSAVSVFRNTSSSGTISFAAKVDFNFGFNPSSISTGDFDGDGKLDLAVTDGTFNAISILRNTGSSGSVSFANVLYISAVASPIDVSIGDLDGDGRLDLVVANSSNSVSVFRNTGSTGIISFAAKVDFTTGSGPYSVSIGDLDGDGKNDLAVANYGSSSVSVFRNTDSNGIISFATKVDFTTGSNPYSVSIGDLDGDGKLDLSVTNYVSNSISVLRNTGSSGAISFAAKVDYTSGIQPKSVSIGDLDGDGKLDLAVANQNSNSVSVFRNSGSIGTISFVAKVDFTTGIGPRDISTGDFDGDGKQDLAVVNNSSNTVSVLKNTVKSPTVTANATATTVCIGASITLTGGGASNYVWTGGATNGVGFVPPIGTTIYTVTGTDTATGCQNTATITITVNPLPAVTANATATTVCAGETITLTGGGTSSTYAWSGGVTNGIAFAPPTGTTTYTVTGTVTATGCQNTATKTITVNPLPTITANATATTVCAGTSITLTGSGNANTYTWSDNVTNGVSFVPPTWTTTYTVTGTITSTGCKNTATKSIIVNPKPISTISATDITKCSGTCSGTATVNVSSGASPFSYLWSNGQTSDIATFLCQGNYSVTVTDFNGCKNVNIINVDNKTISNPNVYLTNLAAIDQVKLSPAFASYYSYNLPSTINANPSNPRNFVDPGKKARFKVECTNQKANGQSIVSGICKVRSNSPYIKITDSSSALNNIGWSNKAWSADEFEIDIDPLTPEGTSVFIDFVVQENSQDYATTCISIPVAPLAYSPTNDGTIDDDNNPDSKGNDNDICEPNETIEFYPWLDNRSVLDAEYVRGRFENLDNHSFIKIWNDTQGVNTRVFDATWWNYSFAKPQTINFMSTNTTPEYDFVFNYKNNTTASDFKLYMVMAGGFKLFNGDALSLVQWSLPYSFKGIVLNDSLTINPLNLSYGSLAGSKQIAVNSNRNWTLSSNQPWVTFNKNSGNGNEIITVNVTENLSNSQRTATVTFVAGSVTKTVTVIQDATVGIGEVNTKNYITVYPNPTSGIVTISSSQLIANIDVVDVTGKLVYSQQNNNKQNNSSLDLSNLSNGIYFINVHTANGGISKSKVVVSK